ncbi:type III-B CRISPR module RAMP protein Cmr4 [Aceticella autotrophica]|uniref:Type III-B CRISPR module RAMP protein Cmr4 n=1 Tax=Aceticella autotrophica TaxID=2755338 RepID=A0A975AW68_9THEO|nr:type III-B CRISPR module RAMP protein Cmr4 [Aceticella autotrophica]QSZ27587.1 type III-B CRISPR module RAMP protein Cmr4 [Aceticella autotrophica]
MFSKFKPFFLIAETPLHPGSGSEVGIVDLPIQRERHTNFPKIEASGLKGSIREVFCNLEKEIDIGSDKKVKIKDYVNLIFGPEKGNTHAGSLAFTDARILFLPVKSLKNVFAWITCPQVIQRFEEDMRIAGVELKNFPKDVKSDTLPEGSNIVISSKIVLEEFTFDIKPDLETKKLSEWFAQKIFPMRETIDPYKYWRDKFQKDLVILEDDEFAEFVSTSTEVIARTIINNKTGTADNLWYEEYLPQDTILYSIAMGTPIRILDDKEKGLFRSDSSEKEAEKVINYFKDGVPDVIQIGGNQTIGKGITRIQILEEEE